MTSVFETYDVTIIIPTYNATDLLVAAVESILIQLNLKIEIIIIEDGSTNPSVNILRNYFSEYLIEQDTKGKNSNLDVVIRYYEQPNMGAYHARLNALVYCNSDYFKFLDQDDFLLPDTLEYEIAALKKGRDVLISNWQTRYYDNTKELRNQRDYFKGPSYESFDDPIDGFLELGGSPTSAVLYRYLSVKDALQPVLSFTPTKADDWLIFAQVCLSNVRYESLDIDSYVWRNYSQQQLSSKSMSKLVYEYYEILNWIELELQLNNQLTMKREKSLANYYAKQMLKTYQQDKQHFNKLLDKVKQLNARYKMQHGNFFYRTFCNILGLKLGVASYSWMKQLKIFDIKE